MFSGCLICDCDPPEPVPNMIISTNGNGAVSTYTGNSFIINWPLFKFQEFLACKHTPAQKHNHLALDWFSRGLFWGLSFTATFRPVWEQMRVHRLPAGPSGGASADYRQTSGPSFALMSASDPQFACCESIICKLYNIMMLVFIYFN